MDGKQGFFDKRNPKMAKRIGVAVAIIVLVLLIVGSIQLTYFRIYSSVLSILYTPSEATVMVNDDKVNSANYRVKPGTYKVVVQMNGFETQEQTVEIEADEEENVYFILESNDESTKNWYLEHEEDGKLRESIAGMIMTQSSENIGDEYPVVSYLPYLTSLYSIGYGVCKDNTSNVCLIFSTERESGIWSVALKRFAQLDSNLGRYNYEFLDYNNPFRVNEDAIFNSSDVGVEAIINETITCVDGVCELVTTEEENGYQTVLLSYIGNSYPVGKDIYRMILQSVDGVWQIVAGPELVLTYNNYPNIPQEVIRKANSEFGN